jgi:hypothetical protein
VFSTASAPFVPLASSPGTRAVRAPYALSQRMPIPFLSRLRNLIALKTQAAKAQNLELLWHQILDALDLPSTRLLLSQQATLVSLDERRAVVAIKRPWLAMIKTRKPLLERAISSTVGSRELITVACDDLEQLHGAAHGRSME